MSTKSAEVSVLASAPQSLAGSAQESTAPASKSVAAITVESGGLYGKVVPYLNDLGPLANLSGFLALLAIGYGACKFVWARFAEKTPDSIGSWVAENFDSSYKEITKKSRKKIKIAVVDDQQVDIPTDSLVGFGYCVDLFTEVSLADVGELSKYDLVVLDISNVVIEDSARGGLLIIKRLKSSADSPPVIAVSQKRYDPSVTEFFKLAEKQFKKPVKAEELERGVSELLKVRHSLYGIAAEIDREVVGHGVPKDEVNRLNKLIVSMFKKGIRKVDVAVENPARRDRLNLLVDGFLKVKSDNGIA